MSKKGSKIFGIIFKLFGKKTSKDALRNQIIKALDTNGDQKLTIDDWANGQWKHINWALLIPAVLLIIGSLVYGIVSGPEYLEYFINQINN